MSAAGKRPTSPISATKTAPSTGPDPGDGLDGLVAGVAGEALGDVALEHLDLAVVDLDQVPQRLHPQGVGVAQAALVEESPAAAPNRSLIGTRTPSLASTAWTWALSPDRSATSLAR